MLKNKRWVTLILALAVSLTMAGALTSEAAAGKLTDSREAPWAQQAITEMNSAEIISGYPDGMFKPYKSVTRLEAIAMLIRVLGLEDQANSLQNTKVDYQMPPNLLWGKGYLIMGVQRGMLDKDHLYQLEPGSPANRAEVAVLVYHALKLSLDGGTLTFADSDQIPQGYRDYVATVVKKNIMQGLPGNLFKPNDEINRAQMAVLLSRLMENKFVDPYPSRRFSGTISTIDLTNRMLSLQLDSSGYFNKAFTSDCEVFLDGKTAAAADLRVGDEVKLILNKSNQVVFINAARSTAARKYTGKVDSLSVINGENRLTVVDFGGSRITYPIATGVKVTDSGSVKDISSVTRNEFVEIKVSENKITEINLLATSTVNGTVSSISSSSITVRKSGGTKTTMDVPDNIVVLEDDSTKTYDDVEEDQLVEVTVYDGKAVKIEILSGSDLVGEIRELDTTGTWEITIRNDDGDTYDYVVDDDVDVERDGDDIDFDDLDTGENVILEIDSDDRVTNIEVYDEEDSSDLEGEIRSLDTTGTWGITIRDDDGDSETYEVDDDVDVERDGDDIDFDDLDTGEWVRFELDDDDVVVDIEVIDEEDSSDLEGEIRSLDTSGTWGITIRDDDGDSETYEVDDDVDVERDGDDIDFDDLDTGEWVRLELDDDDVVVDIEVIDEDDTTITGTVIDLDTGSTPEIRIEKSNGDEKDYDIEDNADYTRDGDVIDLEDIVIGCEVEIHLDNGDVDRIEVTDDEDITVEGEVTDVDTDDETITIEQSNGNRFTYELNGSADLEDEDGDDIDLDDVDEGWDVELELEDGEIDRLTRQ